MTVDWDQLRAEAHAMTKRSYAPYSKFHVGAAALTSSGELVRGCNVENVSYGLGLCAECGLVSDLVARDAGEIVAIAVVSGAGTHCAPCGRCRQILVEHSAEGALIDLPDGPQLIIDLLPGNFDPTRLSEG